MSVVATALKALARILEGASTPVAQLVVQIAQHIMSAPPEERVERAKRALAAAGSEEASEQLIRAGLKENAKRRKR